MNQREPATPEIEGEDPATRPSRPDAERKPDEETPASHPDVDRRRPPAPDLDRPEQNEGLAADVRDRYDRTS